MTGSLPSLSQNKKETIGRFPNNNIRKEKRNNNLTTIKILIFSLISQKQYQGFKIQN